jgi:hypothetical protein
MWRQSRRIGLCISNMRTVRNTRHQDKYIHALASTKKWRHSIRKEKDTQVLFVYSWYSSSTILIFKCKQTGFISVSDRRVSNNKISLSNNSPNGYYYRWMASIYFKLRNNLKIYLSKFDVNGKQFLDITNTLTKEI